MKIVGINNSEKMDDMQIIEDINERNFSNYKNHLNQECKILHTYINKEKGTQTVLIEATADIHRHITENKNKIYVERFRFFHISLCFFN